MALDATAGGASSDSYVTVADTTTYFGTRLYVTDWTSASTANQEASLKWATRLLDQYDWAGLRATQAQALRWPRSDVYDKDDYYIESDIVPQWLKDATGELAKQLLASDRTADSETQGFSRVKIDTIEIDIDKNDQASVIPDSVLDIISFYLRFTGTKLVRT